MKRYLKVLFSSTGLVNTAIANSCKCYPGDSCWPSISDWNSFNQTVNGSLIVGQPPAVVCYPGNNFNQTECNYVIASWFNSHFHAANPISIDYPFWANNSCNPVFQNGSSVTGDPNAETNGCKIGGYSVYAVNASSADIIAATIKWAAQKNIRLVVKNTGHSLAGRSVGFGSLSIWTHNMKSFEWHDNWVPDGCSVGNSSQQQMAATVGAGLQDAEVYELADKHNGIVVGGSNPTVGLMGWFPGGGHGPLSSSYGMGADNLLQAVIVTPDGDIITANQCQNTDIYWALRGGGSGTFGVLVEATVKAFPTPSTILAVLEIGQLVPNATNITSRWWDIMAQYHTLLPAIKDGGGQGYYTMAGPPYVSFLAYEGITYHYNTTNDTVKALYKPVTDLFDQNQDFLKYTFVTYETPTFFEIWNASTGSQNESVAGGGTWITSRLLTRRALTQDVNAIARTLEEVGPKAASDPIQVGGPVILGHMIANDKNRGLNVSLLEAWRDTVVHMLVTSTWQDGSPLSVQQNVINNSQNVYLKALKNLAPESGAYFNEADPTDPDWQNVYFGSNYGRLKQIKQKYDPNGVLWCRSCVGSEAWIEGSDNRLCRP